MALLYTITAKISMCLPERENRYGTVENFEEGGITLTQALLLGQICLTMQQDMHKLRDKALA